MITTDKITDIYCIIDEFYKKFEVEANKNLSKGLIDTDERRRRNLSSRLSMSKIMTIIVCYHFGTFANFKHYYCHFILVHHKSTFPSAVSYNRFVELMPRAFLPLMLFMRLTAFGHCDGISFVDSTTLPVCHNMRKYLNRVFKGIVTTGKGIMG